MSRLIKTVMALVVALVVALPSSAHGADDYTKVIMMSFDGQGGYASTVTETFVGTPNIAPGSQISRMLSVRNDGPAKGVLTATIVNVQILDPNSVDVHHNPGHVSPSADYAGAGPQGDFYDDLLLKWSTDRGQNAQRTFTAAAGQQPIQIGKWDLAKGADIDFTMGYEFPYTATSGNKANVDPRRASFAVQFKIEGADPSSKSDDSDSDDSDDSDDDDDGNLPNAGGPAASILLMGFALIGTGGMLIGRRRSEQ